MMLFHTIALVLLSMSTPSSQSSGSDQAPPGFVLVDARTAGDNNRAPRSEAR